MQPLVLDGFTLPACIQYVLANHSGPSTIVVCSSKDAFFANYFAAQMSEASLGTGDENAEQNGGDLPSKPSMGANKLSAWATPTLHRLANSKTVKLAFCPDITHLRAYLATYSARPLHTSVTAEDRSILAVLNPIDMHRPTSAFSAQGLNRTFAAAVEAAHHTCSKLIIAECLVEARSVEDYAMSDCADLLPQRLPTHNPWDQEVSILNVTTKSFGAGERGWVGRTVKLRAVAERWCTFRTADDDDDDD